MSGILSSLTTNAANAGSYALNNAAFGATKTIFYFTKMEEFNAENASYKKIEDAPIQAKIGLIGATTFAAITALSLAGLAVAGVGIGLGYAAPLTGSAGFVSFAAKTAAFGKATAVFPYTAAKASYLFVAPKVTAAASWTFAKVISPAATGAKYYAGEAAVKAAYAYHTWIVPGASAAATKIAALASKAMTSTVAAFKASVPAGSLVPTFGAGAVAGYFYGRPAAPKTETPAVALETPVNFAAPKDDDASRVVDVAFTACKDVDDEA